VARDISNIPPQSLQELLDLLQSLDDYDRLEEAVSPPLDPSVQSASPNPNQPSLEKPATPATSSNVGYDVEMPDSTDETLLRAAWLDLSIEVNYMQDPAAFRSKSEKSVG
jgi:hypothetical protein